MLDLAAGRHGDPLVDQSAIGEWQAVEVRDVGPNRIADQIAVVLERPVVQIQRGSGPAVGKGPEQVQHGFLALTPTDAVHTILSGHLGKEGRVRTTEHRENPGQLCLEPVVDIQVVALRTGDDRVGSHVGLEVAGDRHRIVVGSHG